MIVWQGLGFLGALIPILTYVVTVFAIQQLTSTSYINSHAWPGAFGTLIGAAILWSWSQTLKKKPGRTLVDPKTGEVVTLTEKHTLFYIPMDYFAIVIGLVGLGMLVFQHSSEI